MVKVMTVFTLSVKQFGSHPGGNGESLKGFKLGVISSVCCLVKKKKNNSGDQVEEGTERAKTRNLKTKWKGLSVVQLKDNDANETGATGE